MPQKPPNKTKTQPGLGLAAGIPRIDSAEMKRVRDNFMNRSGRSPAVLDEVHGGPRTLGEDRVGLSRSGSPAAALDELHDGANGEREPSADGTRRLRDSVRREEPLDSSPPPESHRSRLRESVRREEDPDPGVRSDPPLDGARWTNEAPTGMRPKREGRAAVAVDQVGAAAVKIARTTRRGSSPKLVASRGMIAKAPIDTRAAFVLSLVDGRNTVDALVDMSGMHEEEVKAILERLTRLGLITVP
jgi:hypothetical protein